MMQKPVPAPASSKAEEISENDPTPEKAGAEVADNIAHLWEMERPGPKLKPGSRRWLARYKVAEDGVNPENGDLDDQVGLLGDVKALTLN